MISLKKGVHSHYCLTPEILLGLAVAHGVYEKYGYDVVITSIADGKHKEESKHYDGYAIDLRTRHMTFEDKQIVSSDLATALGEDYDVILESDHIHMEYDPEE